MNFICKEIFTSFTYGFLVPFHVGFQNSLALLKGKNDVLSAFFKHVVVETREQMILDYWVGGGGGKSSLLFPIGTTGFELKAPKCAVAAFFYLFSKRLLRLLWEKLASAIEWNSRKQLQVYTSSEFTCTLRLWFGLNLCFHPDKMISSYELLK